MNIFGWLIIDLEWSLTLQNYSNDTKQFNFGDLLDGKHFRHWISMADYSYLHCFFYVGIRDGFPRDSQSQFTATPLKNQRRRSEKLF